MTRAKVAMLGLLAVFALSASASAVASAATHIYRVEGTELKENLKVEGSGPAGGLETTVAKLHIVLDCQEDVIAGEIKNNKGKGESIGKIEFRNCDFYKSEKGRKVPLTACGVAEGLKAEATDELTEHGQDLFRGVGPNEKFAEFEITGESCAIDGRFEVIGSQLCTIPEAEFEKVVHGLICTPPGSKLLFGKEAAQLFGEGQVKLENKKSFSAT